MALESSATTSGMMNVNRKVVNKTAFHWQISYKDFLEAVSRKTCPDQLEDEDVVYSILGLLFGSSCSDKVTHVSRVARFPVDASNKFMNSWIKYGETVLALNNFLYPSVDPHSEEVDVIDSVSFTICALIQSLRTCVHMDISWKILQESRSFELVTETTKSFHDFLVFLRNASSINGVTSKLYLLHGIHEEIVSSKHFLYNFKCTSLIINTLYKYLDASDEHQSMIWNIFLDVLRPTLKYLEGMLDYGSASDPREEFMFDVHDISVATDKDYWNSCISIRETDEDTSDKYAVPVILKPVLNQLLLAIKSRLLLKSCSDNLPTKRPEVTDYKCLWTSFMERFYQIQECKEYSKTSSSDSGNVSEVDPHEDRYYKGDVIPSDSGVKTFEKEFKSGDSTSGDVTPDILDEGMLEVSSRGHLKNLELLKFPNITPLDCQYYSSSVPLSTFCDNPDFDSLPEIKDCRLRLPGNLKYGLKFTLHEALYSVLIDKCSNTSSLLISSFLDMYLRQLQFHTDYMLLLKPSHSISLCLDNIFEQISNSESLFYKRINLEMYHFDDTADVRVCLLYSSNETKDPIKILDRLHIFYEDLDLFSRLLIDPQTKQVFGDAFHFLLLLRYSKWILHSVKLKSFLPKKNQETQDRRQLKMKHELFCLWFKCMRSVVGLLEYTMFSLQSAVQSVNESTRKADDFNEVKRSLDSFCHSVKQITLQDKKNVVQLIVSSSVTLQELCIKECDEAHDLKDIKKQLLQIEAISNLFVDRMTRSNF